MDRRKFLGVISASALLPALAASREPKTQTTSSEDAGRRRVDLNGTWERYIGGLLYDRISVPSSHPPVGNYCLKREFVLPEPGGNTRAVVRLEAITYWARVKVNGAVLGEMLPYVPHEFDFTAQAKAGSNQIEVEIVDACTAADGSGKDALALGMNPGWEAYGGIIRDIFVELRPSLYVDNMRLRYQLSGNYQKVDCAPRVILNSLSNGDAEVEVQIWHDGLQIAGAGESIHLAKGTNQVELSLSIDRPALWEPSTPHLYEFRVSSRSAAGEDSWKCRTGFRELKVEGRQFTLNGHRLVLDGVCRHDMWKGQGFTLTKEQRLQDMKMIKALGCNYVRLVHYPHDREIVELADELGLLVTEEPGYWIMDFRTMPRGEIELGYEILERTIQRDWNSPSVFAWLLSNECRLTVDVLKEGKARCRRMDPIGRFVSAACNRPKEEAKPIYEQSGMDFFDQHPYTFDMKRFKAEADFYGTAKPLTFTEWGGKAIGQSQPIMQETVDRLMDLIEGEELSGHSFWSWEDVRQYSREDAEMDNGVLESGVVTEDREPRTLVYMELKRLNERRRHPRQTSEAQPEILPLRSIPWSAGSRFACVDLDQLVATPEAESAWHGFEALMQKYWSQNSRTADQWKLNGGKFELWRIGESNEIKFAGMPFQVAARDGFAAPLLVLENSQVEIPVGLSCNRIHILGNVTLPLGFPIEGMQGKSLGSYTVQMDLGREIKIPLRWGIEVVRANMVHEATRIQPIAIQSQPALHYMKDFAREQYQVLLYSTQAFSMQKVARMRCEVTEKGFALAVFGVTAEQ